jgi:putative copper export protein/mono/diheme cytochrome c family protein
LAIARGLQTSGTLSACGTLMAAAMGVGGRPEWQHRLLRASVIVAWIAAPVWLVLQAGEMAGAADLGAALRVAPLALYGSGFGRALALRMFLLSVAAWLGGRPHWLPRTAALLTSALACLLQIRMGHAAAPDEAWQPVAAGLHVLAAAVWIGGLPALFMALDLDAARAARRFSWIGMVAVVIIAATALWQCIDLAGGVPGLLGTAWGHAALLKSGLFAVLLGFAAVNRFVFTPRLQDPRGLADLRWSVRIEAVIGFATIGVAAWLSGQAPGAHEQPIWPLSWQPTLDAFSDDELAVGLYRTLFMLGCGAALLLAALAVPRLTVVPRLLGAAIAVTMIALATPGLGVLLAQANPYSFYESPTGFTRASIAAGAALYSGNCASCHGPRGFGDGPRASTLKQRPPPLVGFHLLERSDGDLFWLIARGIPGDDDGMTMPGFADRLSADERWALIDYVRALAGAEPNSGAAQAHRHH